jgi:hypothetical protein
MSDEFVVKKYRGRRPTVAHIHDETAENDVVCQYLPAGSMSDTFDDAERCTRNLDVCSWCQDAVERNRNPDWGAYRALRAAAESDD